MFTRKLERVGAVILALGSAGFVAIFLYLQATFSYPDILDRDAGEVLVRLLDGGTTLRGVWLLYALLPLTLLAAGIASMPLLEDGGGRGLARIGAVAAIVASLTMMVGLLRWPSIQWSLAEHWTDATPDQRGVYAVMFDAANRYLGNLTGELIGELALAGWFASIGMALRLVERPRWGTAMLVAAAIVALGALRQISPVFDPIAAVSNLVLPLSLFVIAALLWRHAAPVRGRVTA